MTEQAREIKRRKRPDPLLKLIRSLDKNAEAAVERLAKLTQSTDEDIALKASLGIVKVLGELKDQEDKRSLSMIMANAKVKGLGLQGNTEDDDDTPLVELDVIQPVN